MRGDRCAGTGMAVVERRLLADKRLTLDRLDVGFTLVSRQNHTRPYEAEIHWWSRGGSQLSYGPNHVHAQTVPSKGQTRVLLSVGPDI